MNKITALFLLFLFIATQRISAQKRNLELEDIWGNTSLTARPITGFRSLNDGIHYTNTVKGKDGTYILIYEFATGKITDTLFDYERVLLNGKAIDFSDYKLSQSESKIIFITEEEQVYRHSTKSSFLIYDRKTGVVKPLSGGGKQMYASFSPDENLVAFVRDNNLFITDLKNGKETAITNDGHKNSIINGATDWVYEEEFSMDQAFQWNLNGTALAYYKFDESRVKEFDLTYYSELYPKEEKYKYPKAGEENSKVDIYVYHVQTGNTVKMNTGNDREYIPRIKWTSDATKISVQCLNRHQDKLQLLLCDINTGNRKELLKEENNSFIEITDDLTFLQNGKQFIWTSSRSGYNHIYLYNMDGTVAKQVTKGNYDVTNYYGYSEKDKTFYYQSAEPSATERRVSSIGSGDKIKILTTGHGVNKAEFSNTYKYFINSYSAYGIPYRSTIIDNNGKEIRLLDDNSKVKESMSKYNLSPVETLSVDNGEGIKINGWMIKPPDFNPAKKYPVLMFVYGGPGKQTVMNEWQSSEYFWHQLMAERGYIILSFDNRGTKGRGMEFSNVIHKNLGKYEVIDQLAMARYLQSQPYVDPARMGVWGWSYGGYMTSLLLTKGNGLFKCGVAVAPVTNWRYYDNIYTERYLQTPQENPKGYDDNSPIFFAKDLKGKFLMMHGSYDDNVHLQNTMEFADALIREKKQFDMFIYPNKNHSIRGGTTRLHIYTKMTDFILSNL